MTTTKKEWKTTELALKNLKSLEESYEFGEPFPACVDKEEGEALVQDLKEFLAFTAKVQTGKLFNLFFGLLVLFRFDMAAFVAFQRIVHDAAFETIERLEDKCSTKN